MNFQSLYFYVIYLFVHSAKLLNLLAKMFSSYFLIILLIFVDMFANNTIFLISCVSSLFFLPDQSDQNFTIFFFLLKQPVLVSLIFSIVFYYVFYCDDYFLLSNNFRHICLFYFPVALGTKWVIR